MANELLAKLPEEFLRGTTQLLGNLDLDEYIKKYLTEKLPPSDIKSIETALTKNYTLNKHKSTSKKSEVKLRKKTKFISRREKNSLNLVKVGRNSIKYIEVIPLNNLWTEYISEFLELKRYDGKLPTVEDKTWENFSSLLFKADYHGAIFTVTRSTCPSVVGRSGICVMDTKEMLTLVGSDDVTRRIPKRSSVFQIHMGEMKCIIFGKHMVYRPAERSTKKLKQYMFADL